MKTTANEIVTMTMAGVDLYQQSILCPGINTCRGCHFEGNDPELCLEVTGIECKDDNGQYYIWKEDDGFVASSK